eukprot:6492286-Amphidinium_carterae.2
MVLAKFLDGTQDLRPLTGLKRSLKSKPRREDGNESMETLNLATYKNICEKHAKAGPENFNLQSDNDIKEVLQIVRDESLELPYKFKYNLLMRQARAWVNEKEFTKLMLTLNPWRYDHFNPEHPSLAGLSENSGVRLATFRAIVFEAAIGPLVLKGEEQASIVLHICKAILSDAEFVDQFELDSATAVGFDETVCICQALQCLITPTLDVNLQDSPTPTTPQASTTAKCLSCVAFFVVIEVLHHLYM